MEDIQSVFLSLTFQYKVWHPPEVQTDDHESLEHYRLGYLCESPSSLSAREGERGVLI